jgi:hypothetical protein
MVGLPEQTLSICGRDGGGILECLAAAEVDRHQDERPAAGPQYPVELLHRLAVLHDMLEYVAAEDDVERVVGKGQVGDIGLDHRPRALEVGADIVEVWLGPQPLLEDPLRREVEYAQMVHEEIRLLFEVKPQIPLPVPRAAVGTAGIGPVRPHGPDGRHELSGRATAARALHSTAAIEKRKRQTKRRPIEPGHVGPVSPLEPFERRPPSAAQDAALPASRSTATRLGHFRRKTLPEGGP